MKRVTLGKSGINVSCIGLGTWAIGGGPAWGDDRNLQESIDTIRSCTDIGINLIDTAPAYNFGKSEEIIGKALKDMKREDVHIITKCGIVWTREGSLFNKVGDKQLYKNLSKESIMEEINKSLERMGIDYVDVYMTHWQSVDPYFTPISETMEALNELKFQGKIKAIGAANVTKRHIEEYLKYGDLDIIQAKYSVLDRNAEQELFPICKEKGIVFQAYSPLEQGLLTGNISKDYLPKGAQSNKKWFQPGNMEKAIDMVAEWETLCEKYNCTVPNLAFAWILAQGDFINILSGASSKKNLEANIKAVDIKLSPDDERLIRNLAENLEN